MNDNQNVNTEDFKRWLTMAEHERAELKRIASHASTEAQVAMVERNSAVQSAKESTQNLRLCEAKRIEAELERDQWRTVADRLESWIRQFAPRVRSEPGDYNENLVFAVAEFDRLAQMKEERKN